MGSAGPKHFLLHDARGRIDVRDHVGCKIETFVVFFALGSLGSAEDLGPALHRVFDLLFDFLALLFGVQRAHEGVFAQAVANSDFLRFFDELFDESRRRCCQTDRAA